MLLAAGGFDWHFIGRFCFDFWGPFSLPDVIYVAPTYLLGPGRAHDLRTSTC